MGPIVSCSEIPPPRRVRMVGEGRGLPSVAEVVARLRPDQPVHCVRPAVLVETARAFVAAFPGDVLYAVKCNPEPVVLRALGRGGIRHFDVASPVEIALARRLAPDAELHYMHPVKARSAIAEAYRRHGVRDFALDGFDELAKLRQETGDAPDLGLMVRLALPKGEAVCDLSGKFGAPADEAVALLRAARPLARRLGVSFHVGSQCLDPAAFERALALAGGVLDRAGVPVDALDVGGGFPVPYPGMTAPPVAAFLASIGRGVARLTLPATCRLWCEPGRLLVAAAGSLVVRVLRRRGHELFITDGMYGALIDSARLGFRFPARLVRPDGESSRAPPASFALFGPTCDSGDRMPGPFTLPDDVAEGDWIELGQLGSYGSCQRTDFNGFGAARLVEVRDPPVEG